MASKEFELTYSTDEEIHESTETFSPADLPIISIPSPFQTEESASEVDLPITSDTESTSRPSTPSTPVTASLGTAFSYVGISSQTSEEEVFVTPSNPKKRKYVKKRSQYFRKGVLPSAKRSFESPKSARCKPQRPVSALYKDIRFPRELKTFDVKLLSEDSNNTKELRLANGNQIMNLSILSEVFSLLSCQDTQCKGRLRLYEQMLQDGLQKFLLIKCNLCHKVVAQFPTSLPIGVPADACVNNKSLRVKGQSDLNLRSLIAVHTTSQSWEDFRLTCALLDLKVPTARISKHHMSKFLESTTSLVSRSMRISGESVHSAADTHSTLPDKMRNCTVSFDASWHRRGHFSNQGFAAAIDSEFGKVLDYQLYDRVCYPCSNWSQDRKEKYPEDYEVFWTAHMDNCTANYSGSSQSMESSAAVEIWKRSIPNHNLVYGTYIGDGDSSSYKNLVKSDPYDGLVSVRKEECLGHVQKRVKKRLRKSTKDFKGLSEMKADRIAHLYALVIVQHRGESPIEIRDALQVLLQHTEEIHETCPDGSKSWCYFQRKVAEHLAESKIPYPSTREPYLTRSEHKRTVDVFDVFGSLDFCQTVTLGKTQNSNESMHNMLWHNAPKSKRVGHKSLVASTALAVLSFNEGSLSYSVLLNDLGLTASFGALQYLSARGRLRNQSRHRRIHETHKRRRRQIAAHTKLAESSRKRRDKSIYASEKFGSEIHSSGDESEDICNICKQRDCPVPSARKFEQWVSCHKCEAWYHWGCAGIKTKRHLPNYFFCDSCKV